MPRHYLTDALITLLPAAVAGGIGFLAVHTLGRIALLTSGASGLTYALAHVAMPFAATVAIIWVINFTSYD